MQIRIKYILMAISANFGNMFSMSGASLFLSFLPLLPKQILLNNLMTDCSVMSICTDNIDTEMQEMPWKWDIKRLKWFMLIFGLASSIFDYMMFFGLLFIFKAGNLSLSDRLVYRISPFSITHYHLYSIPAALL